MLLGEIMLTDAKIKDGKFIYKGIRNREYYAVIHRNVTKAIYDKIDNEIGRKELMYGSVEPGMELDPELVRLLVRIKKLNKEGRAYKKRVMQFFRLAQSKYSKFAKQIDDNCATLTEEEMLVVFSNYIELTDIRWVPIKDKYDIFTINTGTTTSLTECVVSTDYRYSFEYSDDYKLVRTDNKNHKTCAVIYGSPISMKDTIFTYNNVNGSECNGFLVLILNHMGFMTDSHGFDIDTVKRFSVRGKKIYWDKIRELKEIYKFIYRDFRHLVRGKDEAMIMYEVLYNTRVAWLDMNTEHKIRTISYEIIEEGV